MKHLLAIVAGAGILLIGFEVILIMLKYPTAGFCLLCVLAAYGIGRGFLEVMHRS